MEIRRSIFVFCLLSGVALSESTDNTITYDFKFRTAKYINETTNTTTRPESNVHICRLPDDERINICKKALDLEFCQFHKILYRNDTPLGKEKMYEVELSGIYYVDLNRPPFFVSACMCPTAPPMYLKDDAYNGTDIKIYVDLHVGEDEYGFTKPW